MRDFDININKDGSFQKNLKGELVQFKYDEKRDFDQNDGIQYRAGNISLNGKIDDMQALIKQAKSGSFTRVKVGVMSYSSKASFSDKECYRGIGVGGSDVVEVISDYTFNVRAKYNLFLSRNTRKMDAPLIIEAESFVGERNASGTPASISNYRDFENSIIFNLVVN